jgi:hypothetical protein
VFEGMLFGLVLLYAGRKAGPGRVLGWALAWIVLALAPTLIAWGVYAGAGYGDAFVFANFVSIFKRASSFDAVAAKRLLSLFGLLSPLILLSGFAWRARQSALAAFALVWLAVALAGLLLMGTYYNHYGLPLLVPLSVTAAIGLRTLGWNARTIGALAALALVSGAIGTHVKLGRKGNAADVDHILAYLPARDAQCPWFMGTLGASLYLQSGACLPTRYPLSGHLFERQEAQAIGTGQAAEINAILARSPPVITIDEKPRPEEDLDRRARFIARIKAQYRLLETRPAGKTGVMVFVRNE